MENNNVVTTAPNITDNAKAIFVLYFNDARNWGGEPLIGGNVEFLGAKEDRGLLTNLKRAGLIRTTTSDGWSFVSFTDAGIKYAESLGMTVRW